MGRCGLRPVREVRPGHRSWDMDIRSTALREQQPHPPALVVDPGPGAAVSLVGVDVDVAGAPVLRGVDLAVGPGIAVGLVGPNGSGKTTLLRVLATLLRPAGGAGHVLGAELGTAAVTEVRPSIVLIGHVPALYPRLTLAENLRFLARLTGRPAGKVGEVLEAVGLGAAADRRAAQCSQGMLRRVELARARLFEPLLLLLDEAHSGLDQASVGLVDAVVGDVRRRGGTAVLVSHDPGRLVRLVDRVVEMDSGRVVDRPGAGTP